MRQKEETNIQRPEILSPAGDTAGITAAIHAGADAVYFGGELCNARQRAHNFDHADMRHAIRLCHQHHVKAYLTVNTLIKDSEWPEITAYCEMLSASGIDGLIVQDPGLIWYLRKYYPALSLQTSTQASVGGLAGVLFFESLGFDRVVLPREMPIEEVKTIREKTDVELKVFVHGALCYCRSGQCLMSSLIGGRSGNRGLCAQPCRRKYKLFFANGKFIKSGYLLSMKDLNVSAHLKELTAAGVNALKIEGRLRDTTYIYATTRYYKEAFDQLIDPEVQHSVTENDLNAIFSRDFTSGWMFQKQGHINMQVQKKRGERVGTVVGSSRNQVTIELLPGIKLHAQDGLAFGDDAKTGTQIHTMKLLDKKTAVIPLKYPLKNGTSVFRNKNMALLDKITALAEAPLTFDSVPVELRLTIKAAQSVVYVWECEGRHGEGRMDFAPEMAKQHALTEGMIREQLSRLGDTDYRLETLDLSLGDGLFLSKKALNTIRRKVVREIDGEEKRTVPFAWPDQCDTPTGIHRQPEISLQLSRLSDFGKYRGLNANEWVLPWETPKDNTALSEAIAVIHNAGRRVLIALPEILNTEKTTILQEERPFFDSLAPDGYLIRNYEALYTLRDGKIPLEADANLHLFNSVSSRALKDWGCGSAVISKELDKESIASLLQHATIPCVLTVYGYQEVMISDNCLIDCTEKTCAHCPNAGRYVLKDEKGAAFPVVLRSDGLTQIYNSDKLCLTHKELSRLPFIRKCRIDVLDESASELAAVIAGYRHGGRLDERELKKYYSGRYTVGNFARGVE